MGYTNEKNKFLGKKLFKFFHKPICALANERARGQCSIVDAVTPILRIDN